MKFNGSIAMGAWTKLIRVWAGSGS